MRTGRLAECRQHGRRRFDAGRGGRCGGPSEARRQGAPVSTKEAINQQTPSAAGTYLSSLAVEPIPFAEDADSLAANVCESEVFETRACDVLSGRGSSFCSPGKWDCSTSSKVAEGNGVAELSAADGLAGSKPQSMCRTATVDTGDRIAAVDISTSTRCPRAARRRRSRLAVRPRANHSVDWQASVNRRWPTGKGDKKMSSLIRHLPTRLVFECTSMFCVICVAACGTFKRAIPWNCDCGIGAAESEPTAMTRYSRFTVPFHSGRP